MTAFEPASETVLLFPGQGAYDEAAVHAARPALIGARDVFERIDSVTTRMQPSAAHVCDTVFDHSPPPLTKLCASAPDLLQLTLFGLSVAVYETMSAAGVRPRALVGHSLGEIAALVCGGAFTLEQGAEIVCHRNLALRLVAERPGAMAAVNCSGERARAMLTLLEQADMAVAAENSAQQSVVSGPEEGLAAVERVAEAVSITFLRLQAPYAFHSPLMKPVADAFASRLRHLGQGQLSIPVYSPILGRWYEDGDPLPELLARQLLEPVRFGDAVQQVWRSGARVFVECGARSTLTGLVGRSVPDASRVICLDGQHAAAFPREQVATLRELGQLPTGLDDRLAEFVLPGVPSAQARRFWDSCGTEILQEIRRRYDAFSAAGPEPASVVPEARTDAGTDTWTDAANHAGIDGAHDRAHDRALGKVPGTEPAPPVPAAAVSSTNVPPAVVNGATGGVPAGRDELFADLAAFYAEALEYPVEVFTEDVELEADLGVDSVKQTELIAQVAQRFGLPARPDGFRLTDYPTLGKVVDFVRAATAERAVAA